MGDVVLEARLKKIEDKVDEILSLLQSKHVLEIPLGPARSSISNMIGIPIAEECPYSPFGRHQIDTSMESGPHHCFFCNVNMRKT